MKRQQRSVLAALLLSAVSILVVSCVPPVDTPAANTSITGRWTMDAGTVKVTYRFYDTGTFHRETAFSGSGATYGAGYYTYSSSTLTFRTIGHAEETYSVTISGDTMVWTQNGSTMAALARQSTLDKPADNPPTVIIPEGNITASAIDHVTYTATGSDSDSGDTLEYQWYVDGTAVDSEVSTSFTYTVPSGPATSHTIKVVVSDQKELSSASVVLTVAVSHGFRKWDTGTSTWVDMGIAVPTGTLSAFAIGSNIGVLTSGNVIESYDAGTSTWTAYSPAPPAGMVTASSVATGGNVYLTVTDASGTIWTNMNAGAWNNLSSAWSCTAPSGAVEILPVGQVVIAVMPDGSVQMFDITAVPPTWGSFVYTLPAGIVKYFVFEGATGTPILLMGDQRILRNNASDHNTWDDTGIVVPSGTMEVFLCGADYVIRQ